jgi:hypothetical protein
MSVVHIGGGIVGEAIWTLGFDNNAGDTPQEIADNMKINFAALDYGDLLSSQVTCSAIRVKLGPDETGPSAEATAIVAGSVGGEPAPANCAALVHKTTLLGGRKGRGRFFVPGLATTALGDDSELDPTYQTNLEAFVLGLSSVMVLASLPAHLLHSDATSPTAIEALVVDPKLATQRRRMRR